MGVILTALFAVISANALWELLSILVSGIVGEKEKDMSDKYVTLDEFMNERGEWVKQVVYKVDGDFNGDIKGENVTVILMGNGNINGNIKAKNGEVFVVGMHISPYEHGNIFNKDPLRNRKLLLNKKEINKLIGLVKQQGYSLIPISIYFKGSLVKMELRYWKR